MVTFSSWAEQRDFLPDERFRPIFNLCHFVTGMVSLPD